MSHQCAGTTTAGRRCRHRVARPGTTCGQCIAPVTAATAVTVTHAPLIDVLRPAVRAAELRAALQEHAAHYYAGRPQIPDADYDQLFQELVELETAHPELVDIASPTQTVGTTRTPFAPVAHTTPMHSLHNVFDMDGLRTWYDRATRALGHPPVCSIEPKYDGLAVSLRYEQGQLVSAATRGDGHTGDDVTHTVSRIAGVPTRLVCDNPPDVVEVRGEAYMRRSTFDALNLQQTAGGDNTYANPRNAAAGALRLKDAHESAKRGLSFWAYQLVADDPTTPTGSHTDQMRWAQQCGLPVCDHTDRQTGFDAIANSVRTFEQRRRDLDFDCDGAVVKIDTLPDQNTLGADSRAPRWATAYKFPPEEVTTRLLDIEVSIGVGGQATPWARLEPVSVGGVTVSAATLHNADQVAAKDVRPGDTVIVRRAGEVIPEVVGTVVTARPDNSSPWQFPTRCPTCDTTLERRRSSVAWFCPNHQCAAQIKNRIAHFGSRDAMDIRGLGEQLAAQLVDAGLVNNAADIYQLNYETVAALDGQGETSAAKLRQSIENSKNSGLARVLYGLGIPEIGKGTAARLGRAFPDIATLQTAHTDDIAAVRDIGPVAAQSLRAWLDNSDNSAVIDRLAAAGVAMHGEQTVATSQTLAGETVVVTGKLASGGRDVARTAVAEHGGRPASSVTSRTTLLVAGDKPSASKIAKARALGIPVIDETEFGDRLSAAPPTQHPDK